MNAEERKSLAKHHRAVADRWDARVTSLSQRAGAMGQRIERILRAEHKPTHRRVALIKPLHGATAFLLGEIARCEALAARHSRHAERLG